MIDYGEIADLKEKARAAGLWNLFLPDTEYGAGLNNLEYAPLAEIMGCNDWAPEVFNCNAPDTGNMEVLHMFADESQREEWLVPLLNGEIRSAFAMTEPAVASSDASNIATTAVPEGDGGADDHWIIDGHKWYISGVLHPRCRYLMTVANTDPDGDSDGTTISATQPVPTAMAVADLDHDPRRAK